MNYAEYNHVIPVLSPADIVSTATNTTHIKVTGHKVAFLVFLGTLTGDSCAVTVEESSAASTTSAEAIPFKYRLSAAVGGDTWGAVTTADSGGVDLTADDDDKILWVEVDPADLTDGDHYLSVLLSPGASASACEVAVIALQDVRYRSLNMQSST